MRYKLQVRNTFLCLLALLPVRAMAQSSSVNSYSPYTFYGIGDLSTQGTGNLRGMGGTGVAYRGTHLTPYSVTMNYLNPASYSSVPQRSLIFNVGLENENFYLSDHNTKTSYSKFNVRDIGILFPLGKKIGFGLSVTPFSSVGYRLEDVIFDQTLQGKVGTITNYYQGDGDITQFKAGIGMNVTNRLSLGLEAIYYKGYIDRLQEVYFSSEFGESGFTNTYSSLSEDVSRFSLFAGLQYNLYSTPQRLLTLGATYRMGTKINSKVKHYIPSANYDPNPTYNMQTTGNFSIADVYSAGLYYYTHKWSVGLDYSFGNWGSKNGQTYTSDGMNIKYRNTNSVRAGFQVIPNRYDVRRFMKRLSYRAGFRYEQNYMQFGNKKIDDKAVSIGLGIPLKLTSFSNVDVGMEYGQRGMKTDGLVKINYIKISVGVSFFGDDEWFRKRKFE